MLAAQLDNYDLTFCMSELFFFISLCQAHLVLSAYIPRWDNLPEICTRKWSANQQRVASFPSGCNPHRMIASATAKKRSNGSSSDGRDWEAQDLRGAGAVRRLPSESFRLYSSVV